MAFNFIGVPMFILLIISVVGVIFGLVKKNKKLYKTSLIILSVVIVVYIILFFIFHIIST